MELRFNEGAVVEITLLQGNTTKKIFGKVAKVYYDSIELCEQLCIDAKVKESDSLLCINIDRTRSVDSDVTHHIDCKCIIDWRYVGVKDFYRKTDAIDEGSPNFANHTFNYYSSKKGYCYGSGKYTEED